MTFFTAAARAVIAHTVAKANPAMARRRTQTRENEFTRDPQMKALPRLGEEWKMLLVLKSKPDKSYNRDLLSGPYPLPKLLTHTPGWRQGYLPYLVVSR